MAPASVKKVFGNTPSSSGMEASGMVKSMHVLSSPLEEKFPQLPDSPHVFSSVSGCPTRIHRSPSTIYYSSPKDGASLSVNQDPYPVMQSTQLDGYGVENNDASWNEIQNFLDTPLKVPHEEGQIGTSIGLEEGHGKETNWQEWAEQLITVNDDMLDSNWSDLLIDGNLPNSEPKVSFRLYLCQHN